MKGRQHPNVKDNRKEKISKEERRGIIKEKKEQRQQKRADMVFIIIFS